MIEIGKLLLFEFQLDMKSTDQEQGEGRDKSREMTMRGKQLKNKWKF